MGRNLSSVYIANIVAVFLLKLEDSSTAVTAAMLATLGEIASVSYTCLFVLE